MTEEQFKMTVREHFNTPAECYDALTRLYLGRNGTFDGVNYLFRGEARYHPTSTPGTYRTLVAPGSMEVKQARIDATGIFAEDYEEETGDAELGECLAQHYLSTSDCLDFSASPGVALAFALDEREMNAPRTAYVAVLDRPQADASRRFRLRDLRDEAEALRPVRQHGFVAVHQPGHFFDLKAPACCLALGLVWYSFTVAPGDVDRQRHPSAPRLDELYDIQGDPWAIRMITHLHELLMEPSRQWGEEGFRDLRVTLDALLARNGARDPNKSSEAK